MIHHSNNNYEEANEKLCIYTVTDHLGSGTYGKVYRVQETNNPSVQFALKVVPLKSSVHHIPQTASREVESLKALKDHPHILTYIYAGVIERWPGPLKVAADIAAPQLPIPNAQLHLILTELCSSSTLQTKLNQKKKECNTSFVQEMKGYALQLADALVFIHRLKILHRDLAPRNIFIVQNGAKIGDFGLSRYVPLNSSSLSSEFAKHRSKYTCPDLMTNTSSSGFTKECDVYALGVIFLEMFHPFWLVVDKTEDTFEDLLKAISEPWLKNLITGMVSEDKSIRPLADEVLKALKKNTNIPTQ